MTDHKPKHIICAVRGQPESRGTVTTAIELALEHNARLTFLLVLNFEFLSKAAPTLSPIKIAYRQLDELGEFSLQLLCDWATNKGVKSTDYIIRKGNIPEQLRLSAIETDADVMVLGRPIRSPGRNIFTPAQFDKFVADLEQDANLQIVQAVHE